MSHHLDGMTHHVVEDAATLKAALPEPRHVRPAVLLRRAREIWTSSESSAARPDQLAAAGDVGREKLILEISRIQTDALGQIGHLLRLGQIAGERLLARDTTESAGAVFDGGDDL